MTKTYNQHNSCVSPEYGVRDYGPTDKQSSRSGFRVAAAVISLLAVFALFLCAPAGAALSADVQGNPLSDVLVEGSPVSYTVVITGIPSQTETMELSTDLIPVDTASLWTVTTEGVSPKDSNERLIHITAAESFPNSVVIDVNGRVPKITTTTSAEGISVTKISSQRSGYLYYDIKALDAQGKSLSAAATGTLTITVADEVAFKERANSIDNTAFRTLIEGMYAKGLTTEAWELLEWYEDNSPMPVFVPIIIGVIVLIIGFVAGFVLGMNKKDKKNRPYDEY